MKTISIRFEDSFYEELGILIEEMGQTKQTFFETYARTALRERRIPFVIQAPLCQKKEDVRRKMDAFERLEASRKKASETIDYDSEREAGLNAKYGIID